MWILYHHDDKINSQEKRVDTLDFLLIWWIFFKFSDFNNQKGIYLVHKKGINVWNAAIMLYFQLQLGILRKNEKTHKIVILIWQVSR